MVSNANAIAKRYEGVSARYVLVLAFDDGTKLADGRQRRGRHLPG